MQIHAGQQLNHTLRPDCWQHHQAHHKLQQV
jgi:hypothetical protein